MFRVSLRRLRPGTARSWKRQTSTASKHFAFVDQSDRAPRHQSSSSSSSSPPPPATDDASRAASSHGTSLISWWQTINPARNIDIVAAKPWLRRALVWAHTIRITELAHVSYFLAPAFVGAGLACTVAVVREACDPLALQVPLIPLHIIMSSWMVVFNTTAFASVLEALVRNRRRKQHFFQQQQEQEQQEAEKQHKSSSATGKTKTSSTIIPTKTPAPLSLQPRMTIVDGGIALLTHGLCASVLVLWNHWAAVQVAAVATPLIVLHFARYRFRFDSPYNDFGEGDKKIVSNSSSSSSSVKSTSASASSSTRGPIDLDDEKARPRLDMLLDSLLLCPPAIMFYAGVVGRVDPIVTAPLSLACACWGAMHHSFAGGNSLWFTWNGQKKIKLQLFFYAIASYTLMNIAGVASGQTIFYYAFLAWAHWHMFGVIDHFRPDDSWSVAVARRRMRVSVWLIFFAIVMGNLGWLMLVRGASMVRSAEQYDDENGAAAAAGSETNDATMSNNENEKTTSELDGAMTNADSSAEEFQLERYGKIAEPQTSHAPSTLNRILTMNVKLMSSASGVNVVAESMEQFSWLERIIKPVLVYATVQQNNNKKKKLNTADDKDEDGDGEQQQQQQQRSQQDEKLNSNNSNNNNASTLLEGIDIPVCYRREFFGENVSFLLRELHCTEEQIRKFETKYFAMLDHYTPYGSL